jgi:hypothetical protein
VEQLEPVERVAVGRHDRLPVLSAALATLALIAVPFSTARPADPSPEDGLTDRAATVLAAAPGARLLGGLVVVPAHGDPGVVWTGAVSQERIDGEVVDLGVEGLVHYGYLPSSRNPPAWAVGLTQADQVRSATGPLAFGCIRWPGAGTCTGALLVRHERQHYILRSGIAVPGDPTAVVTYPVLDLGEVAVLTLGVVPDGAVRVLLDGPGGPGGPVDARLSEPGAVDGRTLWWAATGWSVDTIGALDSAGALVTELSPG